MTTGLSFVRFYPDMGRLARWALTSGLRDAAADPGYAVHAATRAALGSLAPKPFALRQREGRDELVGYTAAHPEHLARASALDAHDPEAAAALRLHEMVAKAMPVDWQAGEKFSFEARVAPVVRSRAQAGGGYVEMDAAFHPDHATVLGDRPTAYGTWMSAQLGRDGAAELLVQEAVKFQLTDMVRRTQAAESTCSDGSLGRGRSGTRHARHALLPDLTVRGELRVTDGAAFARLLARGLGRHRAFGYGCLLLAPPGAFCKSA